MRRDVAIRQKFVGVFVIPVIQDSGLNASRPQFGLIERYSQRSETAFAEAPPCRGSTSSCPNNISNPTARSESRTP